MTQKQSETEEFLISEFISVDNKGHRVFDLKGFVATPQGRERLLKLTRAQPSETPVADLAAIIESMKQPPVTPRMQKYIQQLEKIALIGKAGEE